MTPAFVVTGGASGIGAAIVTRARARSERVVVLDRTAPADESLQADFYDVDVADRHQVEEAFDSIGKVGTLVNCAGIRELVPALDLQQVDWNRVLGVNLSGAFFCSQSAARRMPAGGVIVNVASVTAVRGFRNRVAYSSSKAGMLGLTRSLCLELAPAGIRVNAVCPGLIETPLTAGYVATEDARRGLELTVPLGRSGAPEDVAEAVLFLAGDTARYITGAVLPVDGGFLAAGSFDPEVDLRVRPGSTAGAPVSGGDA